MTMKTIEIDFDVHRLIENERRGFNEPENAALRRLLNLPAAEPALATPDPGASRHREAMAGAWSWKGVTLPQGTQLRMEYAGQAVRGRIEGGQWMIEGHAYRSPSDAAGSSVVTKDGAHPSLNGWMYWEVKRPEDITWRRLDSLKPR